MQPSATTDQPLIASDRIAAEQFDDEMVLISIEKGVYYSLRGAATEIWKMMQTPQSAARIVAAFGLAPGSAEALSVEKTIETMQKDGLLSTSAELSETAPVAVAYQPLHFESFEDLAELIAIDPVHEVQITTGWPVRPPGFPEPV